MSIARLPVLTIADSLRRVRRSTATDPALDAAAAVLGVSLPPSYREYASTYGIGLGCRLYFIYIPVEPVDADGRSQLVHSSRLAHKRIDLAARAGWMDFDPDGSEELARRLVPFGIATYHAEEPETLAWDPASIDGAGEMPIYLIGPQLAYVRNIAPDIGTLLRKTVSDNDLTTLLTGGRHSLALTFEPLPL